jgi:tetratricopeptide (TPR) repeat protein
VPGKPPELAAATLPSSDVRAGAEVKEVHPQALAKHLEAVEVPAPGAKSDHLTLARDAFNARDWARALEEGKRAVTAGGGAEAHAVVGNTYFKMGRFADAEQEYSKAIAIEPANKLLRDRLSIAHVRAQESASSRSP